MAAIYDEVLAFGPDHRALVPRSHLPWNSRLPMAWLRMGRLFSAGRHWSSGPHGGLPAGKTAPGCEETTR